MTAVRLVARVAEAGRGGRTLLASPSTRLVRRALTGLLAEEMDVCACEEFRKQNKRAGGQHMDVSLL